MLNFALLTIAQFDFYLLFPVTDAWGISTNRTGFGRFFYTDTRPFTTFRTMSLRFFYTGTRTVAALRAGIINNRLTIPFRVGKMMVGIDKIIDCEKLFPIK